MNRKEPKQRIFEEDEMDLRQVDSRWTPKECLEQDGIFFLKDIVKILAMDPIKVKRKAKEIEERHASPWEVMGARKVWNHWIIRMRVFAPFYRKHLVSKVRDISPDWDGNTILEQKGLFYLTEVARLLPFSTHQLRYQAKRNPRAKEEYGIWKDPELACFLVDMERFGPWIRSLWEGGFKKGK